MAETFEFRLLSLYVTNADVGTWLKKRYLASKTGFLTSSLDSRAAMDSPTLQFLILLPLLSFRARQTPTPAGRRTQTCLWRRTPRL